MGVEGRRAGMHLYGMSDDEAKFVFSVLSESLLAPERFAILMAQE